MCYRGFRLMMRTVTPGFMFNSHRAFLGMILLDVISYKVGRAADEEAPKRRNDLL